LQHLQQFHHELFQDIYDWAGKTRTVDISKGASRFGTWQYVDEQASTILSNLEPDSWLIGRKRETFIERLAYYYGELNAIHPFREGNGRAIRAFLRQLSAGAGWRLDWSALNRGDNIAASRHSFHTATYAELVKVLGPVVVKI
jgi:cell filamentation protein